MSECRSGVKAWIEAEWVSKWVSEKERILQAVGASEWVTGQLDGPGWTLGPHMEDPSTPPRHHFSSPFFAVECIYWAALHNSGIFSETTLLFLETICPHPPPHRILHSYMHQSSVFWRNGCVSFIIHPLLPRKAVSGLCYSVYKWVILQANAKAGHSDWVR